MGTPRMTCGITSLLVAAIGLCAWADESPPQGDVLHQDTKGSFQENRGPLFPVLIGSMIGFINSSGEIVVEPAFSPPRRPICISPASMGSFSMSVPCEVALQSLDYPREETDYPNPLEFIAFPEFDNGIAVVIQNGKYRFLTLDCRLLFDSGFERVSQMVHGLAWGFRDGKYYLLDREQGVIAGGFDELGSELGELFRVRDGDRWGCINHAGKVVIDCEWDQVYPTAAGFVIVQTGEKYGLIDREGGVLVVPRYEKICEAGEMQFEVQENGVWGLLGGRGQVLVEPKYDAFGMVTEGKIKFRQGDRWGYLDLRGEVVIAPQFDDAREFREGRAAIAMSKEFPRWGFIDDRGSIVIPPKYRQVESFSSGRAVVVEPGVKGEGLIDRFGEVLIRPSSSLTFVDWHDGLAIVRKPMEHPENAQTVSGHTSFPLPRGQYGVAFASGAFALEPKYSEISYVSPGLLLVKEDSVWKLVDYAAREVATFPEDVTWVSREMNDSLRTIAVGVDKMVDVEDYHVSCGRKYGYADSLGKIVIPPAYDDAEPFRNGLARVNIGGYRTLDGTQIGGKWGYIDRHGQWIWQPK